MSGGSPRRLRADDRRRQLLSIGLTKLMEKPIQDLAMDEIAAEAGISRGLLFHYFPTKTDYYLACLAAAGRRMVRNTAPDESAPREVQLATTVRLMIEQIDRRRAFYLSLVRGVPEAADVYESLRDVVTDRVMAVLDAPEEHRPVVHAWWAYVEDRAVTWTSEPPARRAVTQEALVAHCCTALTGLLAL